MCATLLPYLIVKKPQAELVLELRESKSGKYNRLSYWFEKENPKWRDMELLTYPEVANLLGHSSLKCVSQAVANGTLLSIETRTKKPIPRVPKLLVIQLMEFWGQSKGKPRPPQLISWRERILSDMKKLNWVGLNGTQVNHRTGCHTPA